MRDRSSEKGAALLLFAFVGVAVLGFSALAIGIYQSVSSRDDYYNVAQMTALGTIEGYFSSSQTIEAKKRQDALDRAQDLLATQTASNSDLMRAGTRAVDYPKLGAINSTDPNLFSVEGGSYYFAKPSLSSDPCSGSYPCFVTEPSTDIPINSFRVTGDITKGFYDGFVKAAFGDSNTNFSLQLNVIATTIPRLGCFVVDVSGSMDDDTHLLRENWEQYKHPNQGHGVKFAYALAEDNQTSLSTWVETGDDRPKDSAGNFVCPSRTGDAVSPSGTDIPSTGKSNSFWSNYFQPNCSACHNFMPLWCESNMHTRPSGETSLTKHYRNDYTTQRTLGDGDYGLLTAAQKAVHPDPSLSSNTIYRVGNPGLVHRVETYRRPANAGTSDPGYKGAEPFNSIINGLKTAVSAYKGNAASGDRVCLVFFDDRLSWTRTILPTTNFQYVDSLLDLTIPTPLANETEATTITKGSNFQRMVRFGIFPGYEPRNSLSGGFLDTDSYTNIPYALNTTLDIIDQHAISGIPALPSITLITNGITNCTLDNDCVDLYDKHLESIQEIDTLITSRFIPSNIPLHVILIGKEVAPHTALLPDLGDGDCLTDNEARAKDLQFVIGGDVSGQPYYTTQASQLAYGSRSSSSPWYNANAYFYNFARRTQGFWLPLRSSPSGCDPNLAKTTCAAMTSINDKVRWFNDPQCRDSDTQIQDAIEQIVGDNPFTIAEIN